MNTLKPNKSISRRTARKQTKGAPARASVTPIATLFAKRNAKFVKWRERTVAAGANITTEIEDKLVPLLDAAWTLEKKIAVTPAQNDADFAIKLWVAVQSNGRFEGTPKSIRGMTLDEITPNAILHDYTRHHHMEVLGAVSAFGSPGWALAGSRCGKPVS